MKPFHLIHCRLSLFLPLVMGASLLSTHASASCPDLAGNFEGRIEPRMNFNQGLQVLKLVVQQTECDKVTLETEKTLFDFRVPGEVVSQKKYAETLLTDGLWRVEQERVLKALTGRPFGKMKLESRALFQGQRLVQELRVWAVQSRPSDLDHGGLGYRQGGQMFQARLNEPLESLYTRSFERMEDGTFVDSSFRSASEKEVVYLNYNRNSHGDSWHGDALFDVRDVRTQPKPVFFMSE